MTTFDQNGLKTLPGDISRPSLVETSSEAVEDTLPRAGYPTVPEYRGGVSALLPKIIKRQVLQEGPLKEGFTKKVRVYV